MYCMCIIRKVGKLCSPLPLLSGSTGYRCHNDDTSFDWWRGLWEIALSSLIVWRGSSNKILIGGVKQVLANPKARICVILPRNSLTCDFWAILLPALVRMKSMLHMMRSSEQRTSQLQAKWRHPPHTVYDYEAIETSLIKVVFAERINWWIT